MLAVAHRCRKRITRQLKSHRTAQTSSCCHIDRVSDLRRGPIRTPTCRPEACDEMNWDIDTVRPSGLCAHAFVGVDGSLFRITSMKVGECMSESSISIVQTIIAFSGLSLLVVSAALLVSRRWMLSLFLMCVAVACAVLLAPVLKSSGGSLLDPALVGRIVVAVALWSAGAVAASVSLLKRTPVLRASVIAVVAATTIAAEWVAVPQWNLGRAVFVGAPAAVPLRENEDVQPRVAHQRFNILVLGGDAGPKRWGLRTDAMHLVSIDASLNPHDGVVIISIPRNLMNAPMPAALKTRFPNGFDKIANALFGWGDAHAADVVRAIGDTDEPGASLVAAMVAEFTGLRVDGWVLTDMRGFIDVVDAAGGVDIWVNKHIRAPGSAFGVLTPAHDFEVGWQRMDGADALSFARARKQDTDYHRMARQRCVLASLAAQLRPSELLVRWPFIASAISRHVRTNLTPQILTRLRGMIGLSSNDITVLSLVPPYVNSGLWTPDEVHALVRNAVYGTSIVVKVPGTKETTMSASTTITEDPRWTCKVSKSD